MFCAVYILYIVKCTGGLSPANQLHLVAYKQLIKTKESGPFGTIVNNFRFGTPIRSYGRGYGVASDAGCRELSG
jgi:hypothetical protein